MTASPILVGCDFSSSPTQRKPIVVAVGHAKAGRVQLQSLLRFDTLASFFDWLKLPQAWVGGFDLPFGLPRELVEHLNGLPIGCPACSTTPHSVVPIFVPLSKPFAMHALWAVSLHIASPTRLQVLVHR